MEVCVDSVESGINAEEGGALRVELACNLVEGGTTPSVGLLRTLKRRIRIPVFAMIRPRGGDFVYSEDEFDVMREDVTALKESGADGFVFGVLTPDGEVDRERCSTLLQLAKPLPATFHRAFDMVQDPFKSLEAVISLGFSHVLTSGLESSALEGAETIKKLIQSAKGRIVVIPGGGITERNVKRILRETTATVFHGSARTRRDSAARFRNTRVSMGASFGPPEYGTKVADPQRISSMVAIAADVTT